MITKYSNLWSSNSQPQSSGRHTQMHLSSLVPYERATLYIDDTGDSAFFHSHIGHARLDSLLGLRS